mmetsp:Transcript_38786/g.153219  ORF Transcript_38786/g.153219 Transcript_38786/m.153219 type:complete len:134 (-) Transcript_38786:1470-1871(-)
MVEMMRWFGGGGTGMDVWVRMSSGRCVKVRVAGDDVSFTDVMGRAFKLAPRAAPKDIANSSLFLEIAPGMLMPCLNTAKLRECGVRNGDVLIWKESREDEGEMSQLSVDMESFERKRALLWNEFDTVPMQTSS